MINKINTIELKIIKYLILSYIIMISFNGIITKFIIEVSNSLLSLKSVLPDIILIILCLYSLYLSIRYKYKVNLIYLIAVYFFIFIFVWSSYALDNMNQFIFTFRDVLLPFILLITLINIQMDIKSYENILNSLENLFELIVITGFILGVLQYINGWEWSSKFYSGYSFYGNDPLSGITIKTIEGQLRVPSISGNHVIFGITNFIAAYIFMIKKEVLQCRFFIVKQVICFINCFLSTSRTAIIMIVAMYLLRIINIDKVIGKILLIISSILLYFLSFFNGLPIDSYVISTDSLIERINTVWKSIIELINIKIFMFGNNVYKVGVGSGFAQEQQSILKIMDNSYIFILFTYGIIGVILIGIILKILCDSIYDIKIKQIFIYFTFAIMIGAIFTNMFQGRAIIGVYFLVYFISKNINKEVS